jgi:two-component system sensor histidine kinase and response regulator WspE
MGSDLTLVELFRMEVENHYLAIEEGLLTVETDQSPEKIEPLMRAAHSIKGAARIVGFNPLVELAHAMEDMFVAAQEGKRKLSGSDIDLMLEANDYFKTISRTEIGAIAEYIESVKSDLAAIKTKITDALAGKPEAPEALPIQEFPPAEATEQPRNQQEETEVAKTPKAEIPNYYSDFKFESTDEMLLDLFRVELENNSKILEEGLLYIEQNQTPEKIEPLMRAAHSIKGAGRIVSLMPIVELAHAMEDLLVDAQEKGHKLNSAEIDLLLKSNDIFSELSGIKLADYQKFIDENSQSISENKYYLGEALKGNISAGFKLDEAADEAPEVINEVEGNIESDTSELPAEKKNRLR